MIWYYVNLGYATFGIATEKNIVIKSAPIGNWMVGKDIDYIRNWIVNKKKGEIIKINENNC